MVTPELLAEYFGCELRKSIALTLAPEGVNTLSIIEEAEARLELLRQKKTPVCDCGRARQGDIEEVQ